MQCVKNEGLVDRLIRIILGIIVILIAYNYDWGVAQIILYILGAILLFTAISGYCCLYKLFGMNTNKNYEVEEEEKKSLKKKK